MEININGDYYEFEMPERPGTQEPVFVFAPPKSGSTFLNKMVVDLAKAAGQPTVDIPGFMFSNSVAFPTARFEGATQFFSQKGFCFSGFRDMPQFLGGAFPLQRYKRIFMMRDPRDMLVSNYYSIRKTHPLPKAGAVRDSMEKNRAEAQELSIDEYVLGEASVYYRNLLDRLMLPAQGLNVLSVLYEDAVFKKQTLAKAIVKFFDWSVPEDKIVQAAARQDVFPESENQDSHIRQVTPGNFREKLQQDTIYELNDRFNAYLNLFEYQA